MSTRPAQPLRRSRDRARARGFTLIEVIVVMAILAILAAIAIPNYTEYIQRGYRSDAKTALLQAAQWQERFRTENNAYSAALPAGMVNIPPTGTRYTIAVAQPGGAQTFTLTATRVGAQAADPCGDFTLDQTGARNTVGGTRPAAQCWER
jgi:type IV pilus assembly protein PilE